GVGLRRGLPVSRLQLLDQPRRLARHDDVMPVLLLVGLDRLAAAAIGSTSAANRPDRAWPRSSPSSKAAGA
ncbi:MAG: hypothetical protein ACYCOX_06765, partial [Acidobacteriaceae bacterium]